MIISIIVSSFIKICVRKYCYNCGFSFEQNFFDSNKRMDLNAKTRFPAGRIAPYASIRMRQVSAEGIEPSTNGLKGHCSAIELRAQRVRLYHGGREASILSPLAGVISFVRDNVDDVIHTITNKRSATFTPGGRCGDLFYSRVFWPSGVFSPCSSRRWRSTASSTG